MAKQLTAPLELRPLTTSDLPAVTRIHLAAFPASALTSLGAEAVWRYYAWQLNGPHEATAVAAWHGAEMAGFYFGGVFRGALSGFLAKERGYLAWRVVTHPWLIASPLFRDRMSTGLRVLRKKLRPQPAAPLNAAPKPPRPRQFGILAIAVHPSYQGAGVGQALMESAEQAARAGDFPEMQLNVNPDNHQAVRFYERLGWQRVTSNTTWQGDMIKPLNGTSM
jgi:ribosomal protein S18 acetylase RimI-like enzyme